MLVVVTGEAVPYILYSHIQNPTPFSLRVHRLFTMDGHLLDDSKNLQDNYFYVAAGLESFKSIPYWKSSWVPSEVQQ